MKIFILNPFLFTGKLSKLSRKRQPLELAYIASLLRKNHEIRLLDANALNLDFQETICKIKEFQPDILILTSTPIDRWEVPSHAHIKLLIQNLIQIINGLNICHVILLGAHGTLMPNWLLDKTKVDFMVRNEPELTVLALVDALSLKKDFAQIKGISFVRDGKIINNPDAERNKNLDELPLPSYDLLPMDKYAYTYSDIPGPFSIMLTSRGCPFNCIYCLKVMMQDLYVVRSPKNIIEEMKYLVDNFNIKGIYFQDWEFTVDKERVKKICDLILENKINIKWGCNARANDLSNELVEKMKKAGCVRINIGFETGSQKLLDICQKKIKIGDVQQAINVCKKYEINIGIYSILNLPGENKKTIQETEKFLAENQLQTMCSPNLPIPYLGTELYAMLVKQEGGNVDWEKLEKYAGRVGVSQSPFIAKIYRQHYKYKYNLGKWYFLHYKFYSKIFEAIKSKL